MRGTWTAPWTALLLTAALCGSAHAQAGPESLTMDVLCDGKKLGEVKLTVTSWVDGSRGGVFARGGFKLTDAGVAEADCWCDQYAWFQAIHITGTDQPDAPGDGAEDYTDPKPGWQYKWGGGMTTGDYAPFLYALNDGKCSNKKMVNRNGKTLYFNDKPSRHTSVADAGDFTWEATLCLVCLPGGTPSGDTKDGNGSFKILACATYGFKASKSGGNYQITRIGPEALGAAPASVQDALDDFNAKPDVGTWTIDEDCEACPAASPPPAKGADPDHSKAQSEPSGAVCTFDAATQNLTFADAPVSVLHVGGDTGPTSPAYAGDALLGMAMSGGAFHLVQAGAGEAWFRGDTNRFLVNLDDPDDDPDSAEHEAGVFTNGNPNGWETPVDAAAPGLVYDAALGDNSVYLPLDDVLFDPGASGFATDLALLSATGRQLGFFFAPDVDLAGATNGFTTTATVTGTATLAFREDTWVDLGSGLAGTLGEPSLAAAGTLAGGTPLSITLTGALPGTSAFLCFGLQALGAPFKGGTLVPDFGTPPGTLLLLPTGPIGTIPLAGTWPPGLPPGLTLYIQYWIVDPGGPAGFSASNAVRGTTP